MTEHYTALLLLSVCLPGITGAACFLAIGITRDEDVRWLAQEVRARARRWQARRHAGFTAEPLWPKWVRGERLRRVK